MLRKLLSTVLFMAFFVPAAALAQTGSIEGTVTDAETGESVPGANVLLLEVNRGAATNAEGHYDISNLEAGTYTLRVTFIGYQAYSEQVTVEANETLQHDIQLQIGAVGLDEVVVTGYGTTTKRQVTGSISSVSASDFEDVPAQSAESILQGRAAGVMVTSTSGNPGGGFEVDIRGTGSINAGDRPLYIVDGVPISFTNQSDLASQSPLNSINPSSIKSIEVLKDASAAAIYGSQAANGVVLITTKRGREGDTQITVRAETGMRQAINSMDYMNSQEWYDYGIESLMNRGFDKASAQDFLQANHLEAFGYPAGTKKEDLRYTDWQDYIFDTGTTQKYSISASGGSEKTSFYISGSFEDTDGHIFDSEFKQYGLRTNLDHQFNSKLHASVNLNLSSNSQFGICQDGFWINCPVSQAQFLAPVSYNYTDDGEYNPNVFPPYGAKYGPAVIKNEVDRLVKTNSLLGNIKATYNFTDWLSFSTTVGLDYRDVRDERYETAVARPQVGGAVSQEIGTTTNFITTNILNFSRSLSEEHSINGLLGQEYRRETTSDIYTRGIGFPNSLFRVLNATAEATDASGYNTEFRVASYFGQVKYDYDNKYYLTLVSRYDGSSVFGTDTRWGFFPSVSAAWAITEEDFFNVEVIDDLKLRAGYGIVGNSDIDNFASRGLYGITGSYQGVSALGPEQLANTNLGWEETHEINVGLDYVLFKGRLSGSVNVYRRDTEDLLLGRPLPEDTGYGEIIENVGGIRNEGIEFELESVNLDANDFFWSSRLSFAVQRNEVTQLNKGQESINSWIFDRYEVGQPISTIWIPRWAGVNPADGRPMWYDSEGNITYSPDVEDRVHFESGQQDVAGGFGNTFKYKGISLDVFFQFAFGGYGFDGPNWYYTRQFSANGQIAKEYVADRWKEPGDIASVPKAYYNGVFPGTANYQFALGSNAIYSKSYIRLKNISLSYNLPPALTEKLQLGNVRLFVTGLNLMTWTEWPGLDPEFDGNYLEASYPTAMQVNGGVEVQF